MAININTTELKTILDCTPAEQNIMLVGRHGIGKSQILTHYFQEKEMPVIALFLGQMSDPATSSAFLQGRGHRQDPVYASLLVPYRRPPHRALP